MLARDNAQPLYQQIYEDIRSAIKNGGYKPGDRVPSEAELSNEYSVSRITVRRAVEDLCSDGYLVKQQGRGTFVAKGHIQRRLAASRDTQGFSDLCRENGLEPGARVLDRRIVPGRPDECAFLGVEEGALLIWVHRVRTADSLPVCDENLFIPYAWAPALMDENVENASLFAAIERIVGRAPASLARWVVTATRATTEQASYLGVPTGEPLVHTDCDFTDAAGRPLCLGHHYFVGSRYEISI